MTTKYDNWNQVAENIFKNYSICQNRYDKSMILIKISVKLFYALRQAGIPNT
jgi:hypothetical protein